MGGQGSTKAVRDLVHANTKDNLDIPARMLDADTTYTFTVSAENWMGQTDAATKTVQVRDRAWPLLVVPGAPVLQQPSWRPLLLQASLSNAAVDPATVVVFSWRLVDGPSLPSFPSEVQGKSQLLIPSQELKGVSSMLIEASVSFRQPNTSVVTASDLVEVQMLSPRVDAVIAGGSRTVPVAQPLELDASPSVPADSGLRAVFLWTCTDDAGQECFAAGSDMAQRFWPTDASSITVPAGELSPGAYVVSVTVKAQPSEALSMTGPSQKSTSVRLEVVAGPSLSVLLSSQTALQPDGNGWLLVASAITPSALCTAAQSSFQWAVQDVPQAAVDPDFFRLRPFPGRAMFRAPLTVRLNAVCGTSAGYGQLDLKGHWGPSMGAMRLSPSEGTSVSSPFTVAFENLIAPDEDYPLQYYVYQDLRDATGAAPVLLLLDSGRQTTYTAVLSPTGSRAAVLGVAATASGVPSEFKELVDLPAHVERLSGTTPDKVAARDAFYLELDVALTRATQSQDAKGALQMVAAACSILNQVSQNTLAAPRRAHSTQHATGTVDSNTNTSSSGPLSWKAVAEHVLSITQGVHRGESATPSSDGWTPVRLREATTRASAVNHDNVRRYLLDVLQSAFDSLSQSQDDLGAFAVALSLVMDTPGLQASDASQAVSLLNAISTANASARVAVPDWHAAALIKSAGKAAALLDSHAIALSADFTRLGAQIQRAAASTTGMLQQAVVAGEPARRIRTSTVAVLASKVSGAATSALDSRLCLDNADPAGTTCVHLSVPPPVAARRLAGSIPAAGQELLVNMALWDVPLYLLPAASDRTAQGPMVQFEVCVSDQATAASAASLAPAGSHASFDAPMVFSISGLAERAGALSSCRWFDTARQQWRRHGFLAFQANGAAIQCLALAPAAGHLVVLSEEVSYASAAGLQHASPPSLGGTIGRDCCSWLVAFVLLLVIGATALLTGVGVGWQLVRAVGSALRRRAGADSALAANRIAPDDEDLVSQMLGKSEHFLEDSGSGQGPPRLSSLLLTHHPLLSLLWSAPRETSAFARLVSFLVAASGVMTLTMLLMAYEFSGGNADAWVETGLLAGLIGLPLYHLVLEPFNVGRRFRALSLAAGVRVAAYSTRTPTPDGEPIAPPSIRATRVRKPRSRRRSASLRYAADEAPEAPLPPHEADDAGPDDVADQHEAVSVSRGRARAGEFADLHTPGSRPHGPGQREYYPDATMPAPSMPTFTSPVGAFGTRQAETERFNTPYPHSASPGPLPSSLFHYDDLLSVAAVKLGEYEQRRGEGERSLSPLKSTEIDWTYTPCPSPREQAPPRASRTASRRSSLIHSRRTSGRSTPTLARTTPPTLGALATPLRPAAHAGEIYKVAGGNFGVAALDSERVIPPCPPSSPRNDRARSSAYMDFNEASQTLQGAVDTLTHYEEPPDEWTDESQEQDGCGGAGTDAGDWHAEGAEEDSQHEPLQLLPGVVDDAVTDAPPDTVVAASSTSSGGLAGTTQVHADKASPFALGGRLSPSELHGDSTSRHSPANTPGTGALSRSIHRSPPPRPRNLELLLASPASAWQLQSVASEEHILHSRVVRALSTIPQGHEGSEGSETGGSAGSEDDEVAAAAVRRERLPLSHTEPDQAQAASPVSASRRGPQEIDGWWASGGRPELDAARAPLPDQRLDGPLPVATRASRLQQHAPSPLRASASGGIEDDYHRSGVAGGAAVDSVASSRSRSASPPLSPRRRQLSSPWQSAAVQRTQDLRARSFAVWTDVIAPTARTAYSAVLAVGGVLSALLTGLLRGSVMASRLFIALFPVTGPVLQVAAQLMLHWEATRLLAPSLRRGLDLAWLGASCLALAEWQVLHAAFILAHVCITRSQAETRRIEAEALALAPVDAQDDSEGDMRDPRGAS